MTYRRRGFTLIELLVVIAIIAILAAILFPVFAKAREKARTSSCASNAKQISLAVMQYTQDYDERYPYAPYSINGGSGNGPALGELTTAYVKNSQLWRCPSDGLSSPGTVNTTGAFGTNYKNVSYAYNVYALSGQSMAQVRDPASVAAIWGAWGGNAYICDWIGSGPTDPPSRTEGCAYNTNASIANGHNGGGTFGYADGHVKWQASGTIVSNIQAQVAGQTSWYK